jgi:hypothetical protein
MKVTEIITEAANPAQQAAIAISMKKAGKKPKNESTELEEEFDLIESIIERLAAHNGVDAEVIWEDLETLTEDELYAFAVTSEPIMESQGVVEGKSPQIATHRTLIDLVTDRDSLPAGSTVRHVPDTKALYVHLVDGAPQDIYRIDKKYVEPLDAEQDMAEDWQKANKRDRTDGMSQKAVNAYRRENPGSKLKTAVTTKPSKLKKGGKASKRRKSYCSRSRGQMKMHSISCAKTPDKAICKARRRWNC